MTPSSYEFLERLLVTPSPTGREHQVQQVVREYIADLAQQIDTDLLGNHYAWTNPGAWRRRMLVGHAYQIGFIVTRIDRDGYLLVEPLGGADDAAVVGATVEMHTEQGRVAGTVGKKPVHLQSKKESEEVMIDSEIFNGPAPRLNCAVWTTPTAQLSC